MKFLSVLKFTVLLCFFASEADAYIDPGTGSLVIQMLIGALVVISLFFRGFWARIKNLFLRVFRGGTSSSKELEQIKGKNTNQSSRKSRVSEDTLSSKESEHS
jgi:hypothetical protein